MTEFSSAFRPASGASTPEDSSDLMDELVAEMCEIIDSGQDLDVEHFAKRLPQRVVEIRETAASLRQLANLQQDAEKSAAMNVSTGKHYAANRDGHQDFLSLIGRTIGHYRIREAISEGGFGFVYVAEQTVPMKRKVALKVIKPGMNSREIVARFEAERQALALMDHPNVARVIDGGSTQDGRPYFVMELVPGTQITAFCQDQKLNLRRRLELFRDVCRAIQHAHLKGIIHRDLKPSNVLVTMRDDHPIAKVIDFGVAKALHQRLTDKSVYTALGQLVGTPLYMSPEQMQLNELDVDTRSDIYALGVLLYELITGTTPFAREALNERGLLEFRRLVCDTAPPNPSRRLGTVQKARGAAQVDQRQLGHLQDVKLVRGELDWIVMKALETDRTRRYQSADAFADDVERFLAGEAVQACPPSKTYRLQKLAKKHRVALTAAGFVLLSLVAGIAGTSYQTYRAQSEANRAHNAETLASQRADDAIQNLELAIDAVDALLAEVADSRMRDVPEALPTAVKIMEDAVEFYNKLVAKNPTNQELRRKLLIALATLAQLDIDGGNVGRAAQTYRQVLPRLEELYKRDKNMDFAAQLAIIYLDAATEFGEHGHKTEWMARPREICAEHDFAKSSDPRHRLIFVQAHLNFRRSLPTCEVTDAMSRARQVYEALPTTFWPVRQQVNGSIRSPLVALGRRLILVEQQEKGLQVLREGLADLETRLPAARDASARRAEVYGLFEDLVEVASLARRRDLALYESSIDHANEVGEILVSRFPHVMRYAWMYYSFKGAAACSQNNIEVALGLLIRQVDDELPVPSVTQSVELVCYTFLDDPAQGEKLLSCISDLRSKEIGAAAVRGSIARLARNLTIGSNVARQLHDIGRSNYMEHPRLLEAHANLAATYSLIDAPERARELMNDVLVDAWRTGHHATNHVAWNCAVYYSGLFGNEVLDTCTEQMRRAVADSPNIHDYQNTMGGLLYRRGDFVGALEALEQAIAIQGDGGALVDWILLSMVHYRLGNKEQAEAYFKRSEREIENWVEIMSDARILFDEASEIFKEE